MTGTEEYEGFEYACGIACEYAEAAANERDDSLKELMWRTSEAWFATAAEEFERFTRRHHPISGEW